MFVYGYDFLCFVDVSDRRMKVVGLFVKVGVNVKVDRERMKEEW